VREQEEEPWIWCGGRCGRWRSRGRRFPRGGEWKRRDAAAGELTSHGCQGRARRRTREGALARRNQGQLCLLDPLGLAHCLGLAGKFRAWEFFLWTDLVSVDSHFMSIRGIRVTLVRVGFNCFAQTTFPGKGMFLPVLFLGVWDANKLSEEDRS
jgi:hypothetical protein